MSLVDHLRGFYVRSPMGVKRMVSPFAALLPLNLRYGPTYSRYVTEIRRSQEDTNFVRGFQEEQLREIFRLSARQSAYYRALFASVFGDETPFEQDPFAALRRIPVLHKEQVRGLEEQFLTTSSNRLDQVSTSGSSGRPFSFYLDKDRSPKEWAFINMIWGRIGFRPGHQRAVLRGVLFQNVDRRPWDYDPALGELRLSPFHLTPQVMDLYLSLIARYHIDFIHGYPSAVAILAAHAIRTGWHPPASLKGILPISESLYPHQREIIQKAFGTSIKIMPFYGMSEKVAIAGEVPGCTDLYEFEPLYGFTELLDDEDNPVTRPGKPGRIVSTGFLCKGMPLLRYDTGDRAVLVQTADPQNVFRLRVSQIRSRWSQEFLVASSGALVSMTAINIHSPAYTLIKEFQFFQDTPGLSQVRIVPTSGMTGRDLQPFVDEIQEKVGQNLTFELKLVDQLPQNSRGKRGMIDQKLDLNCYQQ